MADRSKIEWTDATWNVITGCSVVSPGCKNCYAMKLAGTRLRNHPSRRGLTIDTKAGPVWNGQVRFNEEWLDQPLRWTRPRMIFVCAHGDLFHEGVEDWWIDQVFAIMSLAPQHVFQVLTKRTDRMARYLTDPETPDRIGTFQWDEIQQRVDPLARRSDDLRAVAQDVEAPLRNVWLGFSAEDQTRYDERWRYVEDLAHAGWLTWLSAEPLLGPLDAREGLGQGLAWVVAGGESGPAARPAHPDWFRQLRDDCQRYHVPFHFKQWGAWAPGECIDGVQSRTEVGATWHAAGWLYDDITPKMGSELHRDDEPDVWLVGKKHAGRLLDGRTWDELPEPRP